jgi:hypothetical protein
VSASGPALYALASLIAGVFTNEEQVWFERDAGRTPPPWVGVRVDSHGDGSVRLRTVDAFGRPGPEDQVMRLSEEGGLAVVTTGQCVRRLRLEGAALVEASSTQCRSPAALVGVSPKGLTMRLPDGRSLDLQRARPFVCWVAVRKAVKKVDGSEDWAFERGVRLHDRGGRATVATQEAQPQSVTIRMRNVEWREGPNQPSLVLYMHRADPERAEGYAWADPGARRVGVNLRFAQASCTLDPEGVFPEPDAASRPPA